MSTASSSKIKPEEDAGNAPLLPQYGFGAEYTFDSLVRENRFLFRVHTPRPRASSDDPSEPYFLAPRYKEGARSPDWRTRQRTLSTLSGYTYVGEDSGDESEAETAVMSASMGPGMGLSRSASLAISPTITRLRSESARPAHRRARSAEEVPLTMTYEEVAKHMDWTTRGTSPYVTTSFSFAWALWEAVRRYKIGVKHDVEIAVIDARKVIGQAVTALELLRKASPKQ